MDPRLGYAVGDPIETRSVFLYGLLERTLRLLRATEHHQQLPCDPTRYRMIWMSPLKLFLLGQGSL
jgi:hypothetical protein